MTEAVNDTLKLIIKAGILKKIIIYIRFAGISTFLPFWFFDSNYYLIFEIFDFWFVFSLNLFPIFKGRVAVVKTSKMSVRPATGMNRQPFLYFLCFHRRKKNNNSNNNPSSVSRFRTTIRFHLRNKTLLTYFDLIFSIPQISRLVTRKKFQKKKKILNK